MRKHRVGFAEAALVFDDPLARIFDDEDRLVHEAREIIIGHSTPERILVVCFTERATDVIRIFSARLATKQERRDCEENVNLQVN